MHTFKDHIVFLLQWLLWKKLFTNVIGLQPHVTAKRVIFYKLFWQNSLCLGFRRWLVSWGAGMTDPDWTSPGEAAISEEGPQKLSTPGTASRPDLCRNRAVCRTTLIFHLLLYKPISQSKSKACPQLFKTNGAVNTAIQDSHLPYDRTSSDRPFTFSDAHLDHYGN